MKISNLLYLFYFLSINFISIFSQELYNPPILKSSNKELHVTLNIQLSNSLNNTRISPLYNGNPMGPTLHVEPGDKLYIHLNNLLSPNTQNDKDKMDFITNPANDYIEATKIYNRFNEYGEYSGNNWGRNYMNLHLHGIQVNPIEIDSRIAYDGGINHTYIINIPNNHPPAFGWYHNHNHGTSTYSMLSGLYGLIEVINSEKSIMSIPEVNNATHLNLIMGESLTNLNNNPVDSVPIIFEFNWIALTNGVKNPLLRIKKNDTVLFRIASASIEPDYILSIEEHKVMPLAYDGHSIQKTPDFFDDVTLIPGGRVEFMVKFDKLGNFKMLRNAWNLGISGYAGPPGCENNIPTCPSICSLVFGISSNISKCISYDIITEALTIVVSDDEIENINKTFPKILPLETDYLLSLKNQEHILTRNITMDMYGGGTYEFQIPLPNTTILPSFTQLGMNGKIISPPIFEESFTGEIQKNTCELWDIKVRGIGVPHPFHVHSIPFLVKKVNGINLNVSEWRDTYLILPDTVTQQGGISIHICFPSNIDNYILAHCHMPSHQDLGMGTFLKIIEKKTMSNELDEVVLSKSNKKIYFFELFFILINILINF